MRGLRVGAIAAVLSALISAAAPYSMAAGREIVVSGQISFDHADGFGSAGSAEYPMLETATERLALVGVDSDDLTPGVRVRVHGHRDGSGFIVSEEKGSVLVDGVAAPAGLTANSEPSMIRSVAVLLINFVDEAWTTPTPAPPAEPWTKEMVRDLYFTGEKSVAAYYSELSDGQLSITGDVFGYFTLNVSTLKCNYNEWGAAARQAAAEAGIDLSTYANVVHAFPRQEACWWRGVAVVPGTKNWINGSMTLHVATHELGHNLGVAHASTTSCLDGAVRVSFSSTCTTDEYGDPFDIMGYTAPRQMHSWHRYQLGLLTAADVQTVTSDGIYHVAPVELEGASPRVLRVLRSDTDYFYVEFRQPHGEFDDFSALDSAVNGVLIRLAPDLTIIRSKLIDATPDTTFFSDASLAVGQTFTDPLEDIRITLLSTSATGAQIDVQLGGGSDAQSVAPRAAADGVAFAVALGVAFAVAFDADVTPPAPVASLSVRLTDTDQALLEWTAATDDTGVDHFLVTSDGIPLVRTKLTELDAIRVLDGFTYELGVRAVDASGNAGDEVTVQLVVPDVTPPTRLRDFAAVRSGASVALNWRAATDNIALIGYTVFRDGRAIASLGAEALSYTDDAPVPGHVYRYAVAAADAAGNLGVPGTATLAVGNDVSPPSAPTGLTATSIGGRRVVLSWNASSDDGGGGVVKYQVFRGARKVAMVTSTTYTDRPARAGTYAYRIRAVDSEKNKSAFGETVVGIAARRPPPP